MTKLRIAWLWLLLLLGGEVTATRIFHEPLEQVLNAETPVIRARVVQVIEEVLADSTRRTIQLEAIQVVHLRGPEGQQVVHVFSTNLERQADGKVVKVSPILEGSGLEQRLQSGTHYYFLLDTSGQYVRRVEPDSSAAQIRKILGI